MVRSGPSAHNVVHTYRYEHPQHNSLGHEDVNQGLARGLSWLREGHHFHTRAVHHVGHGTVVLLKPPVTAAEEGGGARLVDGCRRGRGTGWNSNPIRKVRASLRGVLGLQAAQVVSLLQQLTGMHVK